MDPFVWIVYIESCPFSMYHTIEYVFVKVCPAFNNIDQLLIKSMNSSDAA